MEQDATTTNIRGPETCLLYAEELEGRYFPANCRTDLSLEFLMGRALDNAMLNTGLKDVAKGSPH